MSKNLLVPSCLVAMLATGLLAGGAAYEYTNTVTADSYYASKVNALQLASLNSIMLAMRAASDPSHIAGMDAAILAADDAMVALRRGNSAQGIPGIPASSALTLDSFENGWTKLQPPFAEISKSRASNSAFPRLADDARQQISLLLAQAKTADRALEGRKDVKPNVREALNAALADLVADTEFLVSGATLNSDSVQLALDAVTRYLATLGQAGSALPRETSIVEPMLKSFRSGQTAQRSAMRASESAGSSVDNGPHARAIWSERPSIETSLNSLQNSITGLAATRLITPMMLLGSTLAALLVFIGSVIVIIREARQRTRQAESMGSSIQVSQKERSKELVTLFDEMERVQSGDLTTEFTEGLGTTNEIAMTLNSVFSKFRGLVKDVQQTMLSLSAASEQTLQMAKNVTRNRSEQEGAINQIARQNTELNTFIESTEQLTARTKKSSEQVSSIVKTGSSSVNEVHEGVVKLSQSNMNIMHHTKAMTENIQSLERIVGIVRRVANQSTSVAMNAFLVADAITDENLSKRIKRSAEAMQDLTSSSNEAVEQIETSLRGINDAAKDTQVVLDSSQQEIQELLARSLKALESLNQINTESSELGQSMVSLMEQTSQLKLQSEKVAQSMDSIHHYASENSAASEQTASAISNLNSQAQNVGETLSHFKV